MGTRIKRCSAVPPDCQRWEVAEDCAAQGMLCDATSDPPVCFSPPTCADGILNQDETDVDCGGECSPCFAGSGCQLPEDCESGLCESGVCLLCDPGSYRCRGNWLDLCAANGASWQPDTHCDMASGVGCDAEAGMCHLLSPIGNGPSNPTGWYYQFAYFNMSNAPLQGGVYDVDVPIGGVHQQELYITTDTIFYLGSDAIYAFDRVTSAVNSVVAMPTSGYSGAYETLGFNEVSGTWFFGTREREVYSWDANENEWVWEIKYPNLAGSHMDGLEVVVDPNTGIPYVYATDMTSDFIGQYREDEDGKWTQHNLFQYSQPQGDAIEGMGFGTLNHFWCGSGSVLYEIGGGDLSQYTESFSPTNQ
jgi:hypothetical protein